MTAFLYQRSWIDTRLLLGGDLLSNLTEAAGGQGDTPPNAGANRPGLAPGAREGCQNGLMAEPSASLPSGRPPAEDPYRRLVAGVRDDAILLRDNEGRIVTGNAGATRITGYEEEET